MKLRSPGCGKDLLPKAGVRDYLLWLRTSNQAYRLVKGLMLLFPILIYSGIARLLFVTQVIGDAWGKSVV